jgi:DNA-binding MarR family transcriptional regulator
MLIISIRSQRVALAPEKKEIGYVIKVAQQALHTALDSALSVHKLTMSQYAVLFNLARHPGASSAELARLSFVTPQTMIRLIQALEHKGLVVRVRSSESARILEAQVTTKGARVLEVAHREVDAVYSRMLDGIQDTQLEELSSSLKRMIRQLEQS